MLIRKYRVHMHIQYNNFSKTENTWWWSYTAETCSEEEGLLENKLHLRRKYMWNKWYINATGCLNIILRIYVSYVRLMWPVVKIMAQLGVIRTDDE
jgi:hypothetical protein